MNIIRCLARPHYVAYYSQLLLLFGIYVFFYFWDHILILMVFICIIEHCINVSDMMMMKHH